MDWVCVEERRSGNTRVTDARPTAPAATTVSISCQDIETPHLGSDVTDRKAADKALVNYRDELELMINERTQQLKDAQAELVRCARLATIGRLTATVSHELRNPLGAIRNAAYLLKRRKHLLDEKAQNYVGIVERELIHSEQIINNLLETTRVK